MKKEQYANQTYAGLSAMSTAVPLSNYNTFVSSTGGTAAMQSHLTPSISRVLPTPITSSPYGSIPPRLSALASYAERRGFNQYEAGGADTPIPPPPASIYPFSVSDKSDSEMHKGDKRRRHRRHMPPPPAVLGARSQLLPPAYYPTMSQQLWDAGHSAGANLTDQQSPIGAVMPTNEFGYFPVQPQPMVYPVGGPAQIVYDVYDVEDFVPIQQAQEAWVPVAFHYRSAE